MLIRFLFAIAFCLSAPLTAHAAGRAEHFILVVCDGLRADAVSPVLMPALWELRTNGVWFTRHHSVYPTSTEVNGTALATGAYPRRSGVLANNEYRAEINLMKSFATQDTAPIRRGDEISGGKYLGVPTVAELFQQQGWRTAVAGSKPVVLLHDRAVRGDDAPGANVFGGDALPRFLWPQLTNRFGPLPARKFPNTRRDEWTTRVLIEGLWATNVPKFSVLWCSDPDATQHADGPGSTNALAAIRGVDRNLSLLLGELDRRGLRDKTDIIVASDHGFSRVEKNVDVAATLRAAGLNTVRSFTNAPATGDVILVSNGGSTMIYVVGHETNVVRRAVETLQQAPFAGVLFTRDGLPGTFALSEAKLDAPHAPDIVLANRWQDDSDHAHGARFKMFRDAAGKTTEQGMHVTLSPTDLHNVCVASGPDFRAGFTNTIASGNTDIAPTILWLAGIKPPQPLDGRVLEEALFGVDAEAPGVGQRRLEASVAIPGGIWEQYLSITEVNGVRYLEEGNGKQVTSKGLPTTSR